MRIVAQVFGIVIILLGTLWLLQGLGLIYIEPVVCVANCEPVEGPVLTWVLAGLLAQAIGAAIWWLGRRRRKS